MILTWKQTVTSVDSSNKTVILEDGKEKIPYDTLILASGGVPRRLPIEGANFENVYTLRTVQDAQKIDSGKRFPAPATRWLTYAEACQEGKHLVVIGSSFISMELVVAVSKRKLASIHVIGIEEYPFQVVLGKEIGAGLKQYHETQGIVFHGSTSVKAISKESDEALTKVELSTGEVLSADLIVMGVGMRPATDYLKASGWELEKDGSVKVDELLRVPGHADVYAIGDIATYPQLPGGTYRRIEHWNVGTSTLATCSEVTGNVSRSQVIWAAQ